MSQQPELNSEWSKEILGAIARGWTYENNAHKEMDSDLALAIYSEIEKSFRHLHNESI
jgi:hypothetical protein